MMTTVSMLPPKVPPPLPSSSAALHGSHRPLADHETQLKYEDTNGPANLNEESMMMLSQSVDSLHTLGTNGGVDEAEHQVRTVFVSGLPLDAKPRELYLLFRCFKGYQSSTLKPAGKNGKLTAPVGFVTFESRQQAEEAMTKLQGVKFDPEGNQHMRLEFARTNTKVTKPKFPQPGGFASLSPTVTAVQASLGQHVISGCSNNFAAGSLQGLVAGLQPALFSQLTNSGTGGPFDPSTIFTTPEAAIAAAAAAAAAAAQWNAGPGNPQMGSAYDNAAYLASAAGLLQTNNFRTIIPGNLGSAGFSLNTSSATSLQMMQAAIAQANAVAALGATSSQTVSASSGLPVSPRQHQSQQLSPVTQCSMSSPIDASPTSPSTGSRITPLTISTNGFAGSSSTSAQAQMNSLMAQLQQHHQQQQALAAVQQQQQQQQQPHGAFASSTQQHAQQLQQSLGFSASTAGFQPQMTAAAIGLLGGYNSLVKELTGGDAQLSAYHQHVNF